ncbi:MAG: cytosine deaminase, partial [Pyramidobacter sp.]|nr:cytosine deaminase [Pyramidobacter sp.]
IDPKTIEGFGRQRFDFGAGYIGALGMGGWADLQVVKNGAVRDVYVGGRKTMEDGRLLGLDVERDVERPLREEVAAMTAAAAEPEA